MAAHLSHGVSPGFLLLALLFLDAGTGTAYGGVVPLVALVLALSLPSNVVPKLVAPVGSFFNMHRRRADAEATRSRPSDKDVGRDLSRCREVAT